MNRLHWKIAALLVALVLGTIILTSWTINYTMDSEFQSYLKRAHAQRIAEISLTIAKGYQNAGNWDNFLSNPPTRMWLRMAGIIRIQDANGQIVFAADPVHYHFPGHHRYRMMGPRKIIRFPIKSQNHKVGTAWTFGPPTRKSLPPIEELYQRMIQRAIVLSSLFAAVIALLVGLLGAERLSRPIQALIRVARRLAGGDLTARVSIKSQDEIGQLAATLNHLAAELEAGERSRQNALADTAHELRTPLTAIQSHLEAMNDGILAPNPENINVVLEEVARLAQLTDELQSLTLVQRFRDHCNKVPVDLKFLLEQVAERHGPLFQRKGITLVTRLPERPILVSSNSQALHQILDNLLMNAAKYTPEHDQRCVSIDLSSNESNAIIRIIDEGIGIPPEDLPHIFQRFYRVDPSRSRSTGGVGLGLAIANETAEAIGGHLSAESLLDHGTTFTLTLPLSSSAK
jgi:signal transduction histidine kinase